MADFFDMPLLNDEDTEIGMQTPIIHKNHGNMTSAICSPFHIA